MWDVLLMIFTFHMIFQRKWESGKIFSLTEHFVSHHFQCGVSFLNDPITCSTGSVNSFFLLVRLSHILRLRVVREISKQIWKLWKRVSLVDNTFSLTIIIYSVEIKFDGKPQVSTKAINASFRFGEIKFMSYVYASVSLMTRRAISQQFILCIARPPARC